MMMSEPTIDWQGREVENEDDDANILVWEIEPSMQSGFDTTVIRGWQRMLMFVNDKLDMWLEDFTEDELREGVSLKFKLTKTTPRYMREIEEATHAD